MFGKANVQNGYDFNSIYHSLYPILFVPLIQSAFLSHEVSSTSRKHFEQSFIALFFISINRDETRREMYEQSHGNQYDVI